MLSLWQLPTKATIGGREYEINTDFRDILEIFSYLNDPELPEFIRWEVALTLFFTEVPEQREEAAAFLCRFITGGEGAETPGPRLLDWQADASAIIADVNKVAGQEIRAVPYIHWWTFLSWFQAIGEGQLSTLVSIRQKLCKGKKLEDWEKEFYRENKKKVDLPKKYSAKELAEQERLNEMLNAECKH